MSTKSSAGRVRQTYEFIKAHGGEYSVQMTCRVLGVAPTGYYEWVQQPISNRAHEEARLLHLIRASFVASQGVHGAPRVFLDLREAGETCSRHRVERIKKQIYRNRELAAADVADDIVTFYNRSRRHGHLGGVSP